MQPESPQETTRGRLRAAISSRGGFFRRGTSARELFLVKFAFWAVVVGLVLLVVLILWGLATHEPSQSPFGPGD